MCYKCQSSYKCLSSKRRIRSQQRKDDIISEKRKVATVELDGITEAVKGFEQDGVRIVGKEVEGRKRMVGYAILRISVGNVGNQKGSTTGLTSGLPRWGVGDRRVPGQGKSTWNSADVVDCGQFPGHFACYPDYRI